MYHIYLSLEIVVPKNFCFKGGWNSKFVELLNVTAYRVFKILCWLMEAPLSAEALNQRFAQDARTRKRLSSDSICLYINTLRALGCQITRPSKKNGFCYELLYQPLGIPWNEKEIETLIRVKTFAENSFSYQEVLLLHQFIKKVLQQAALPNREHWLQQIFAQSRTVDYEPNMTVINDLQSHAKEQRLLLLTYDSPVNGQERFYFLPDNWTYRQGILYLNGYQLEREQITLLRLERILKYETVEHPDVFQTLLNQKLSIEPNVVIHFLGISQKDFEPLNMQETLRDVSDASPRYLEVTLRTREFFILKQKLLSYGLPFNILEPESFRTDVRDTLLNMQKVYSS